MWFYKISDSNGFPFNLFRHLNSCFSRICFFCFLLSSFYFTVRLNITRTNLVNSVVKIMETMEINTVET